MPICNYSGLRMASKGFLPILGLFRFSCIAFITFWDDCKLGLWLWFRCVWLGREGLDPWLPPGRGDSLESLLISLLQHLTHSSLETISSPFWSQYAISVRKHFLKREFIDARCCFLKRFHSDEWIDWSRLVSIRGKTESQVRDCLARSWRRARWNLPRRRWSQPLRIWSHCAWDVVVEFVCRF